MHLNSERSTGTQQLRACVRRVRKWAWLSLVVALLSMVSFGLGAIIAAL
jgi:hypothetical protein